MTRRRLATLTAALLLVLAACSDDGSPGSAGATTSPSTTPAPGVPATTAAPVASTAPAGDVLDVTTESWDEGMIRVDDRATSRFWGVVSAPVDGGPYPVVVLLHGNHPVCRDDPSDFGSWPCPEGTEIPNHEGLRYLAEAVAEQGRVVVAPGVNVQHTLGAGEPPAADRTAAIVTATLEALEAGELGVPGERADPDRLVLVGHSVGGQDAGILAAGRSPLEREVDGIVLLAPAVNDERVVPLADVPAVVQVGVCDGDTRQVGGELVSRAMAAPRSAPAVLVALDGVNHNFTNSGLRAEGFPAELPGCDDGETLTAEEQQALFAEAVPGWVSAVLGEGGDGWAAEVFDGPTPPAGAHLALLEADEPPAVLPGGSPAALEDVTVEGFTATFCPQGYYTPFSDPGSEPCHRPELPGLVGNPESVALSWDRPGATLTAALPAGTDRLRLRIVPDVADDRLGEGPVVLRLSTPDGWSQEVPVDVPVSRVEDFDPFVLTFALLLWQTAVLDLPAPADEVTLEVVSPDAGAIQLVWLGPA